MSKKLTKVVSIIFIAALSVNTYAQIDSAAVAILDTMSSVVTNLESCSFTLKAEYDIYNSDLGLIKHSDIAKVYLKAPDKLLVKKKGDKGQKDFYYDGKTFYYYSVDNNQYAMTQAPPTIMETIDSISDALGVEFPAADIFYPDLVDTLLENAENLIYLGLTSVDDRGCYHIAGTNKEFTYQIWIAEDGSFLPIRIAINYVNQTANPQYVASFSDWSLNPDLEDSMFDFVVQAGAKLIKFTKKQ